MVIGNVITLGGGQGNGTDDNALFYALRDAVSPLGSDPTFTYTLSDSTVPVSSVPSGAFTGVLGITEVWLSECTTVGASAFAQCTTLSSVSMDSCSTVGSHAFRSCTSLTGVSFPVLTDIRDYAFDNCPGLDPNDFCAVETVGACAFAITPTSGLSSSSAGGGTGFVQHDLLLPSCTTIGVYAFECRAFNDVSLPAVSSIDDLAFGSCTLSNLYLMGSSVASVASDAFSGATGPENVYVPASLYDAYLQTPLSGFNLVSL